MSPWVVLAGFLIAIAAVLGVVALRRVRAETRRRLERERARIAMDLHDELGSGLGSIGILAGLAADPSLDESTRRELTDRIANGADALGTALTDIVWSLRPDANSVAALAAHLVERAARLFPGEETVLVTRLPENWPPAPLSLEARRSLQAIAVEALHNAARHARAQQVELGIAPAGRRWRLWVEDDGRGIPEEAAPSGNRGRGLANMRRRAEEIGADITWTRGSAGGTRVEIQFQSDSSWRAPPPAEASLALRTIRPPRRAHAARETAFYGREAELSRLDALLDEARSGRGRVVLIEGEAGIGKTRLIDEFALRLRRNEVTVRFLYGSYPPGGAATPTNAFAHAYREHLGDARFEETLRDYLTDTPTLVPAFAALLRGLAPPRGAAVLTKDAMHTLFANLTRALALEVPTIVVIDDLHFAPDEGRALFAALALGMPAQRVLLAGTMRPEMPPAWMAGLTRLEHTVHLTVPRLDLASREQLLREALESPSVSLAPELVNDLSIRSDGNPFFVLELAREMRAGGGLVPVGAGTSATATAGGSPPIPQRIMDLIAARLSNLPAEDRDLLELAGCWGFEFDPRLIAAAAGEDLMSVLRRFTHVEREYGLIRQLEASFVFDHHQIQEVLTERLFPPLRQQYHAALAEALEERERIAEREPEAGDGPVAVQLADHFIAGGQGARALRYLRPALAYLKTSHAGGALVELAERALEISGLLAGEERMNIQLLVGEELDALARFDESKVEFQQALDLAQSLKNDRYMAKAHRRLGVITTRTGSLADAISQFERSRELAHDAGDSEEEVLALGNLALVLSMTGRSGDSRREAQHMLALAREIGDRVGEVRALGALGNILHLEDEAQAMALHRQALEIAETLDNKGIHIEALMGLGTALREARQTSEARKHLVRMLTLAREMGHRLLEMYALLRLADVSFLEGEYEEALTHNQKVLLMAETSGRRAEQCNAHLGLFYAQVALGHFAAALDHAQAARSLASERGLAVLEEVALHCMGETLGRFGDMDRARAALEQSLSMAAATQAEGRQVEVLSVLGKVHEQVDALEAAARTYQEALRMAVREDHRMLRAPLLADLGGLLVGQGSEGEGREHLDTAIGLARTLDLPGVEALAQAHLARLPGGDAAAATASLAACEKRLPRWEAMQVHFVLWEAAGDRLQLESAHQILHKLVEHAPESYRPGMLANVALHRRIEEAWTATEAHTAH